MTKEARHAQVKYPRVEKWFPLEDEAYKDAGIRFRLWTNVPRRVIKLMRGEKGQSQEKTEQDYIQVLTEIVVEVEGLDGISFDTPEQTAQAYDELDSDLIEFIFDCFWADRDQRRDRMGNFRKKPK